VEALFLTLQKYIFGGYFWQLADLTSKSIYQGIRVVVSHETILDGLARDLSITAPTPP